MSSNYILYQWTSTQVNLILLHANNKRAGWSVYTRSLRGRSRISGKGVHIYNGGGGGGGGGGFTSQISSHLCGQIIYYCISSPLLYCNQYARAQISFVMIILIGQGSVFLHVQCWPFQFLNKNASVFQTRIMFWGVRLYTR